MTLNITNIARNSIKFTVVNFLATALALPVSLYAATILFPSEYGIFGVLGLWSTYATLVGPGITGAAQREMPVLRSRGMETEAVRVQNISITSETLYSLIPFAVILGASFFSTDPVLRIGFILTALGYAIGNFVNYWSAMNFFGEKFNVVAKGNLGRAIVSPLVIAATVYWLRVYALILAPLVCAVVLGVYYWKKGPIGFRFTFDRAETLRLIRVGIILQALTLIFWGFRLTDRTVIASMLPLEQLGLYVYAIGFVEMVLTIPTDFGRVLQPIMWREAGKASSIVAGFADAKRIAVYVALGAAMLIPLAQLGFYLMVSLITTKYIASIPIFYALSFNIFLASIVIVPGVVLNSSMVNKQRVSLVAYAIGLVLNVAFAIFVVKLGFGVVGVAWVTIGTQGLTTFLLYSLAKGYMFRSTGEFFRFQARILLPFGISVLFYLLHHYLTATTPNYWAFAGISVGTQAAVWALVIGIFYRDYLSITHVKQLVKEARASLKKAD